MVGSAVTGSSTVVSGRYAEFNHAIKDTTAVGMIHIRMLESCPKCQGFEPPLLAL